MYLTVYSNGMTQENGKETLEDFVKRSRKESLDLIKSLSGFAEGEARGDNPSGFALSDFGLKIAIEKGKLEILHHVEFLIQA